MESHLGATASILLCFSFTFLQFFFALAGVALLRSQLAILRRPEFKERLGSRLAAALIEQPEPAVLFVQLGSLLSAIGFVQALRASDLLQMGSRLLLGGQAGVVGQGALLFLLLALHLLIGGIVGQGYALSRPENVLMRVSPIVYSLVRILSPLLWLIVAAANALLKPFGTAFPKTLEFTHFAADFSRLFNGNREDSEFDEDEKEMLQGVFGFSNTVAREVMTPRTDIVSIHLGASLAEIVQLINESGKSRFPVRGATIDDVRGVLLARDMLPILASEKKKREFSLPRVMRKAYFIPDTKAIDDLLNEFKRRKLHMAIVLDEHGGVDGLVTLEDLLEEIVGDIYDESDIPEQDYQVEESGDVIVDGGMLVYELNEDFDLQIPEGDYDTIAGFIFTTLGRMPHVGDVIEIEANGVIVVTPGASMHSEAIALDSELAEEEVAPRVAIIVEQIESNRIASVRIKPASSSETAETQRSRAAS